jgi:hypothetical protein
MTVKRLSPERALSVMRSIRHEQRADVVGQRPSVQRLGVLDQSRDHGGGIAVRREQRGRLVGQALGAQAGGGAVDLSLDEAVGVEQQGPRALGEHERARSPAHVVHDAERRSTGRDVEGFGAPVDEEHRRGMAGDPQFRGPAVGRDGAHAERAEDRALVALGAHELLEAGEHLVGRAPGEHKRAPCDPQADAERGLVGPVAADIADDRVDDAVLGLDRVIEVAAQQRAPAAGAIAGRQAHVRVVDERPGQQPALQARVLGGVQARDV